MKMTKRLGIVIDQERCIGCEACSVACRIENDSADFWIKVETQGGNSKDTPQGVFPDLEINFLPKLCNHCEFPPCIDACPIDALYKRDDGLVILDRDLCNGCRQCLQECPYNVIIFNEKSNSAEKCNMCVHRIDQGMEPFCVICCEGQAMIFGDLNEHESNAAKRITGNDVFQLRPELEINPSIYYIPPRAKRKL